MLARRIHPPVLVEALMAPRLGLKARSTLMANLPLNLSSDPAASFASRHIGPREQDVCEMLATLGISSLDELIAATVPERIRTRRPLSLDIVGPGCSEQEALAELGELAAENEVYRSFIGMGYSGTFTPPVILRNVLENPRWYTPYTPYQSEVSQGRLEALLNFQTMVADLTGMEIANASLLDEATAAAEAMSMAHAVGAGGDRAFFVSDKCHPQTIAVVRSRAEPLRIPVLVGCHESFDFREPIFGALIQYPATDGTLHDYTAFIDRVHAADALAVVAADILSLAILTPPGEFGADIVVGNTQRFGVPMGYGGPHAAFMATRDAYKRHIPGRIVGVTRDAEGGTAVRLALQTREQHIRRDKATSNICTAQVLLAVVASMYAIWHGPEGIRRIAEHVHGLATALRDRLHAFGIDCGSTPYFDTVTCRVGEGRANDIVLRAAARRINLRRFDQDRVSIALDETATLATVKELVEIVAGDVPSDLCAPAESAIPPALQRTSEYLTHPVFHSHRSETGMLRYLNYLAGRDISLADSMIPLGSCTMKLNATAEMIPVTWQGFGQVHPFAPRDQAKGYARLFHRLESMLADITGFDAVSLQPNAGSQGEYAGLLVIRAFHRSRGESHRDVCLIPQSAHGTNPATAVMAGMRVVVVKTDSQGNVDIEDLHAKAAEHRDRLGALMITYPSTHGVFEEAIVDICETIHRCGGQVYMDGANMNAQVGICRPGEFGPDVCHLNLHKTFCIPHGGGGPGVGPICVRAHLARFLPGHPEVSTGGSDAIGPVSAATWGSASILPISYAYIRMMGAEGLRRATEVAILTANYVARRIESSFPILYKGAHGFVAHECIADVRPVKSTSGVEVEDVAKRLMDYGFHAPTVSFPVPGTMMIEPTESESREEIDRFCDAMIAIRAEILAIEREESDRNDNLLKNAPHTAEQVAGTEWSHPYSREQAAWPMPWTRVRKYWPPVARVDNVYGERNIVCSCPSPGEFESRG